MKNRIILAGIGVFAPLALFAGPAEAHTQDVYNGADHAWTKEGYDVCCGTPEYHRLVGVKDNECDGNRVYANVQTYDGYQGHIYDDDGCSGHGAQYTFANRRIQWFQVCEERPGGDSCSHWEEVVVTIAV